MSNDDDSSIQIAETSPYVYTATAFFTLSALSSDLLFIRFSLMSGFVFLVLAAWSGFSSDGSFSKDTAPFVDGTIDITLIINTCLFLLNFLICCRLIDDERPKGTLSEDEQAMYRFFHCRCGLTRLQFDEIRKHGHFLELDAGTEVPCVESTLYLVLEGVVECRVKFSESQLEYDTFLKRSGQFFDIQLFNVFTLPIGFDSTEFRAKTTTRTRLFAWKIKGLVAMRDCHSPSLQAFWEYMVLRCLAASAVRHHLRDTDRLYDAWLIPEEPDWLEGAPSRDFGKQCHRNHLFRQLSQIYQSIGHIIPPRGIRHPPPCSVLERRPKQDCVELRAMAVQDCEDLLQKAKDTSSFQFLSPISDPGNNNIHDDNVTIPKTEIGDGASQNDGVEAADQVLNKEGQGETKEDSTAVTVTGEPLIA